MAAAVVLFSHLLGRMHRVRPRRMEVVVKHGVIIDAERYTTTGNIYRVKVLNPHRKGREPGDQSSLCFCGGLVLSVCRRERNYCGVLEYVPSGSLTSRLSFKPSVYIPPCPVQEED